MSETSDQPAPSAPHDASPAFKVGETVVVEGVVVAVWPADGSLPPGMQVQFPSHAQPDRGWTRTPVPVSIVRRSDKAA